MVHRRGGLLAQIEGDVVDDAVPLSSLLQKCIVLGGQTGSEKMRDWARRELNGYAGADTVPDYRHVPAALMAVITNRAGYNGITQRFDDSVFPRQIRDIIREQVDLEDAILGEGIGVLEAMAGQGTEEHRLIPSWSSFIADTLNQHNMAPNSRVAEVYWSVSNASIRGVLVRVRTALAELVAELITLTPQDQEVPDKAAADQAVQFVITGDRATIYYSSQHATDGGTNVAVSGAPAAGPVTVSGAYGSAIGSQTASGANSRVVGGQAANGAESSVVGGQVVQAGHDAVTAGQDASITGTGDQPMKEGWWARLRKRGMVVAFATIIGAIAAVVATAIGIFVWVGWTP
jgi:AbiTii